MSVRVLVVLGLVGTALFGTWYSKFQLAKAYFRRSFARYLEPVEVQIEDGS